MSLWLGLHVLTQPGRFDEHELPLAEHSLINLERAIAISPSKKTGCFIIFSDKSFTHVRETLVEVRELIDANEFIVCINCLNGLNVDHDEED